MEGAEHTYSVRLVRPFVQALRERGVVPAELDALARQGPDDRVPVRVVLPLLDATVAATGDDDLGLRAAAAIQRGDLDVLEFAASSCRTRGDALAVMLRYMPLVNDAAQYSLIAEGDRAVLALQSSIALSRAAADFQVAAVVRVFELWLGDALPDDVEIWYAHAAPASTAAYAAVFGGRAVQFEAPADAIVFSSADLALPLSSADATLHTLLRRRADDVLARQPKSRTCSERVRQTVAEVLAGGAVSVDLVAERLGMSRRTLARHLADEGTTYTALFERVRRGLATQYLAATTLALHEVAFLVGFSDAPAFSRAFKRWVGCTPGDYRRRRGTPG